MSYEALRYFKKLQFRDECEAIKVEDFLNDDKYKDQHIWDLKYLSTSDEDDQEIEDGPDEQSESSSEEESEEENGEDEIEEILEQAEAEEEDDEPEVKEKRKEQPTAKQEAPSEASST